MGIFTLQKLADIANQVCLSLPPSSVFVCTCVTSNSWVVLLLLLYLSEPVFSDKYLPGCWKKINSEFV